MPQNPLGKSKLIRSYKTKTEKCTNYSKTRKQFFHPQKTTNWRGTVKWGYAEVDGKATITGG
jgi:hypothetical protein